MHHEMTASRAVSLGLALAMSFSLIILPASAETATDTATEIVTLTGSPYADLEYSEDSEVRAGTIRYVSQNSISAYFYESYWNEYSDEAYEQCGTCSMSMALSYIGIDALPDDLADLWGANGGSFGAHFNEPPSGVTVYSGDFYQEFENYVNGNGSYSPIIIHLDSYSTRGHFVIVAGQLSDTVYQVIDPYTSAVWELTIVQNSSGTLSLSYTKNGTTYSETTTASDLRCIQYYNPEAEIHETDFIDIYNTWLEEPVDAVTAAGLFNGAAGDLFEPDRIMTRQEAAAVIYRLAGSPDVDTSTLSFTDVLTEDWFTEALEWAVQTGVMNTDESGLLNATESISRQDFITMLYRYEVNVAGNSTREYLVALNDYTDRGKLYSYAIIGMQWAVGSGLITSTTEDVMTLSPREDLSRGSAAVILYRYLQNHS